jgi:hypothetical protein
MRRLFWLGAGIALGVVAAGAVSRAVAAAPGARTALPTAAARGVAGAASSLAGPLRERLAGYLDTVAEFVTDVREGMAVRSAQIEEAFAAGVPLAQDPAQLDAEHDDWAGWPR